MPLPDGRRAWPPIEHKAVHDEMARHSAWFSGDTDRLQKVYGGGGGVPVDNVDASRPSIVGSIKNFFWGRRGNVTANGATRHLHIPLASDICRTSADLLAADPPSFNIPEAEEGADPDDDAEGQDGADTGTRSEAMQAQERLEEIIEEAGIHNGILEGCEWAAALGGAYLRPVWDRELVDRPMLSIVQADEAVPEFRHGILVAVTFFRELASDGIKVVRHLERYERGGHILHGLYESSDGKTLGRKIPLTEHTETADLADSLTDGDRISVDGFPENDLLVRYIPNIRPNRRHKTAEGRSDLQGIEGMLDALDEVWTSWMRDVRLGQARVIVDRSYLEGRPGAGMGFNVDNEIYAPMDMGPGGMGADGGTKRIEQVEFKIRSQEHYDTALALREDAVTTAGYSAQSFMPRFEGSAESGTARRMRERKSFQTKAKKERYIRQPIAEMLEIMLFLDKTIFGNPTPVLRPNVVFSADAGEGPRERAETVELLQRARAISIRTGIEMTHPDWGVEEVDAELDKILTEEGMKVPDIEPMDIA